jgi:predicted transposase YbfD/YdcC
MKNKAISMNQKKERNRGRIEKRKVTVYDAIEDIDKEWIGLKTIIKVERMVKVKHKKTKEIAYYISSLPKLTPASLFNDGIRSHWAIENALHYVKDTTFKEDASKIRTKYAPQNISILKTLIINIFRNNGFNNIAQATRLVANDIYKMKRLILA